MLTIKAIVEKVLYYNEDNGFIIIKAYLENQEKDFFSIKGNFFYIDKETPIVCDGEWKNDPKFGKQFDASQIKIGEIKEVEKIKKYLSSGVIKGIGPKMAIKIVDYFKEDTLNILDENVHRLEEISGIGSAKVIKIKESWEEKRTSQKIISDLINYNISYSNCLKIYSKYKEDTLNIIKEKPYQILFDIKGIGFETVDNLAIKTGIKKEDPVRILSALINVIKTQESIMGDTCIEKEELILKSKKILKINNGIEDILKYILEKENKVIHEVKKEEKIYYQSESTFYYESTIAKVLNNLNNKDISLKIEDKSIDEYLINNKFPYTEEQKNAIKNSFCKNFSIITGGPGVGKTTILKAIIDIIKTKFDNEIIKLASPTGKAAKRMTESTGRAAQTIHRLLEYDPEVGGFKKNKYNKLEKSFIIIDEFSMVDLKIFYNLIEAIDDNSVLILIGDIDQLASVGFGAVLRDLINSNKFKVTRLKVNNRTEKMHSNIIENAHEVNNGNFFKKGDNNSDFYYIKTLNNKDSLEKLIKLININIPKKFNFKSKEEIQVLTPIHKSDIGTLNLNLILQNIFNKNSITSQNYIEHNKIRFYEGEKIIQTKNNYDKNIFNGDTGEIVSIRGNIILVDFDGNQVELEKKDLSNVSMFYAGTIHKSQGSEFDVTIIIIPDTCMPVLDRSSLYTAITRGKKLVIVLGNPEVIDWVIKNSKGRERKTLLVDKINNIV